MQAWPRRAAEQGSSGPGQRRGESRSEQPGAGGTCERGARAEAGATPRRLPHLPAQPRPPISPRAAPRRARPCRGAAQGRRQPGTRSMLRRSSRGRRAAQGLPPPPPPGLFQPPRRLPAASPLAAAGVEGLGSCDSGSAPRSLLSRGGCPSPRTCPGPSCRRRRRRWWSEPRADATRRRAGPQRVAVASLWRQERGSLNEPSRLKHSRGFSSTQRQGHEHRHGLGQTLLGP